MKLSFGVIVLNGEPFTRYCLEALYPHAHQILVAEGAAENAGAFATPDGHSIDGTLEVLRDFQANHDPEGKVEVITSPTGFWESRDEQSRAYAARATGDYLWQVDIDEFYLPGDIEKMRAILAADPSITGASFRWLNFWGDFQTVVDGWFLRTGGGDVNRLMKWGPGFRYGKHWEGPRSYDPDGRDMTEGNWLSAGRTAAEGIRMFHYALVFPDQVLRKSRIYQGGTDPTFAHDASVRWADEAWRRLGRPFDVHNRSGIVSWLRRYDGAHPEAARALASELRGGDLPIETRPMDDVRGLLGSGWYRFWRMVAGRLTPLYRRLGDSHRRYWLNRAVWTGLNEGWGVVWRKGWKRVRGRRASRNRSNSPSP